MLSNDIWVTGQKPPTKSPRDKSHPDKSPSTINPLGSLERLLRNMPLTLTSSESDPPILKKKPTPVFFSFKKPPPTPGGAFCPGGFCPGIFCGGTFDPEPIIVGSFLCTGLTFSCFFSGKYTLFNT